MLGEIWLAMFIDVQMISYVACCSERTSSTKMRATLFSEPARQNAQHSCAFLKNILWQIMPSLLNSEVGAGDGLPDGLVMFSRSVGEQDIRNDTRQFEPISTPCP